jgi:hypothetical protein
MVHASHWSACGHDCCSQIGHVCLPGESRRFLEASK